MSMHIVAESRVDDFSGRTVEANEDGTHVIITEYAIVDSRSDIGNPTRKMARVTTMRRKGSGDNAGWACEIEERLIVEYPVPPSKINDAISAYESLPRLAVQRGETAHVDLVCGLEPFDTYRLASPSAAVSSGDRKKRDRTK